MKLILTLAALSLAGCLSATSDPGTPNPQEGGGSDTETLTGLVSGADG